MTRSCLQMILNTNCIDYVTLFDLEIIIAFPNYFYIYIHGTKIILTIMIISRIYISTFCDFQMILLVT